MTDVTQTTTRTPDDIAGQLPEVADARKELVVARNKELADLRQVGIEPYHVPQSSFPERMKQGIPGMVNRMVDYNAVTRSVEGTGGWHSCLPRCLSVGCLRHQLRPRRYAERLYRHHHPRSDQHPSNRLHGAD